VAGGGRALLHLLPHTLLADRRGVVADRLAEGTDGLGPGVLGRDGRGIHQAGVVAHVALEGRLFHLVFPTPFRTSLTLGGTILRGFHASVLGQLGGRLGRAAAGGRGRGLLGVRQGDTDQSDGEERDQDARHEQLRRGGRGGRVDGPGREARITTAAA